MIDKMKKYLIASLLGLLFGAVFYAIQPVRWESQALVRIGQMVQTVAQGGVGAQSNAIEPLALVIERLKSPSFVQAVASRAKNNEIATLLNVNESAGLTVKNIKNSDALLIKITGASSGIVQSAMDAVTAELIARHNNILTAGKVDVLSEISSLNAEIDTLSKRLASPAEGVSAKDRLMPTEGESLAARFAIIEMQHEQSAKIERVRTLNQSVSSLNMRPTMLVEPVAVLEKRMINRQWRSCLFGMFLGIFLCMVWVKLKK
jgi:hypothetical protein